MCYTSFSEFLFPKQVIISDSNNFPLYRNELIKLCYQEKEIDPQGSQHSNAGGWQSKSNHIHNSYEFKFLFDDLFANIIHCMYSDFNLIDDRKLSIRILNSWINISKQHDYNITHSHPLSVLSGVYYIKCLPNCGNIVFVQDGNDCVDLPYRQNRIMDLNKMHSSYYYTPIEGRLILFPSGLQHYVESNKSSDDRISVSFNILIS